MWHVPSNAMWDHATGFGGKAFVGPRHRLGEIAFGDHAIGFGGIAFGWEGIGG